MQRYLPLLLFGVMLFPGCPHGPQTREGDEVWGGRSRREILNPPPTRKQKLVKLLDSAPHPSEEEIRKLGDRVHSDLVDLVTDGRVDPGIRVKAIEALGFFQNRTAKLVLRNILTDPSWGKPYKVAALPAIARSVGMEAFDVIRRFITDPDVEIRLGAVKALGVLGSPEALELLEVHQLREREPVVIDAIDRVVRKLERNRVEVK